METQLNWKQLVHRAHALAAVGASTQPRHEATANPTVTATGREEAESAPAMEMLFNGRWIALVALLALIAGGCEPVTMYVDPITDYQDSNWEFPVGTPEVTVGFYSEQLYAPLDTDSPLYITEGFQGGTWSMPAVRTRGIASPAQVGCDVTLSDGTVLGSTQQDPPASFQLTTDGWLEVQAYPVPVMESGPDHDSIYELFGLAADLECTVTDADGRSDTISIPVFLEQG